MKFSSIVVVAACAAATRSEAFVAPIATRSAAVAKADIHRHMASKNAGQEKSNFWGPVAAALASLGLASQVAFASPAALQQQDLVYSNMFLEQQSSTVIAALSGNFETMDFSMPSYDASTTKPKAPPAFNPFDSFTPEIKRDGSDVADDSAQKAAEAKAAEAKAAAEAKKAEDKAAAEAKKAEEEARRAEEREARRQAELEKQRAAVERAKQQQEEAAAASAAAAAAKESAPAPEAAAPPAASSFKFEAPDVPDFKIPEFKAPDISIPEFKAPEIPKFSMPKFDMPAMPSIGGGSSSSSSTPSEYNFDVPKFEAPKFGGDVGLSIPKFEVPSISLPSLSNPFAGDDESDEPLAPQEVRDEKAREARLVYLAADQDAKDLEAQARALRDLATEKKKEARLARNEACKTRLGGKLLCIRNPFKVGY